MGRFFIIGSGISGCTAGYELAEMGHDVHIAETGNAIGGKILSYCCKATEECSKCGVCVAHTKVWQALKHQRIAFSTGAEVGPSTEKGDQVSLCLSRSNPSIDYKKCIDCGACIEACPADCISRFGRAELVQYMVDYSRCSIHNGAACTACVDACPTEAISGGNGAKEELEFTADGVLLATGHEPFDAVRKVRYGYGRFNNVITGAEAEEMLVGQNDLGDQATSIAFIQCVGSRDPQIGHNYCSSVCCSYALRLARVIKHRNSNTDITVYYIDIQQFDKTFSSLREELISSGITFVRGLPFRVDQASKGKLKLFKEDVNGGESIAEHDMVVLSVGLEPSSSAEGLAGLFRIDRDEFGFLRGRSNIFVSGTCKEPQSIPDSMTSARSTALKMAGAVSQTQDGIDGER